METEPAHPRRPALGWLCRPGADGASATALQPPPHLLTTLPAPAGGGRRGSPGRGLRGARDQGAGGRATRRWKAMGSDGVRSAELTTHGSGAGLRLEQRWRRCASGLIIWSPSSSPTRSLSEARPGRRSARWADVYDRDRRRRPQNRRISRRAALSEDGRGFSRWAACGRRRRPRCTASSPRNASPCASDAVQP